MTDELQGHSDRVGTGARSSRATPAGNLYPKAYAPKSVPGFTPFYYNVPSTGFKVTTYDNGNSCKVVSTATNMGGPLTLQNNGSLTYCGTKNGATIASAWGQPSTNNPATTTVYQNGNTNTTGSEQRPLRHRARDFPHARSNALTASIGRMKAAGST